MRVKVIAVKRTPVYRGDIGAMGMLGMVMGIIMGLTMGIITGIIMIVIRDMGQDMGDTGIHHIETATMTTTEQGSRIEYRVMSDGDRGTS